MTRRLDIYIAGTPVGKGRPRFVRATGRTYTPEKTASFENLLRLEAQRVMRLNGAGLLDGPLDVSICAYFPVPKSYSKRRQAACLGGDERPTKKPDPDNILKMIDALNGVVWHDDAQVVTATIRKFYAREPGLLLRISEAAREPLLELMT